MVCGATLRYHEKAADVLCNYCDKPEHGHITCPHGHYICDSCHNQDSMRMIENIIYSTESTDPFAIAELAMNFPGLPMLGCQHAYIAAGALMAALKNESTLTITNDDIQEVFNRTEKQAQGGYCGLTGVCGIVPAIGGCFALLTGSKCGKDEEQRTTMAVVAEASRAILELTGPSCCKAYVRAALRVATAAVNKIFNITLAQESDISCLHNANHPHGCRREKCPYYSRRSEAKVNIV
jgi:hypothetical protein